MASYFDLLVRIQTGDKQAKGELYEKFKRTIKKLCRYPVYEDEENDLNEFFVALTNRMDLKKFKGANDKQIAGYIHRCLKNERNDLRAKYEAENSHNSGINIDRLYNQSAPDVVDDSIAQSELLNSLPLRQRKVLIRRYHEGYSIREISVQLNGITPQAVNRLKKRAKNNLEKARGKRNHNS